MERSLFLSALEAALTLKNGDDARGALDFARNAGDAWLARWPGDTRVRALLASARLAAGDTENAGLLLAQCVQASPESVELYRALAAYQRSRGQAARAAEAEAFRCALDGAPAPAGTKLPQWADTLAMALRMLGSGRWQEARLAAESVMAAAPEYPLPALLHLKAVWQLADHPFVLSAGREYRSRWPGCAAILLLMAQSAIASGKNAEGVEYLHAAATADPAGETTDRYLGSLNPYRTLWPARLEAEIGVPIPTAVAAAAGFNRLAAPPAWPQAADLPQDIPALKFPEFDSQAAADSPMVRSAAIAPIAGERFQGPRESWPESPAPATEPASVEVTQPAAGTPRKEPARKPAQKTPAPPKEKAKRGKGKPEPTVEELRERLNKVAARLHMRKSFAHEDRRRPAYILLTSRKRLASVCGAGNLPLVDKACQKLLAAKRAATNWSAYQVDAEDGHYLEALGLSPVDASNAWQVKKLLGDLDAALEKKGEMIGAVLILGGHEVIPFHLLPNPTDDSDQDVPSDNPYMTRDENYYVPEWPVGRIPTPPDGNADLAIGMLARAAETIAPVKIGLLAAILGFLGMLLRPSAVRFRTASGVSASIWLRASQEVFKVIGSSGSLLVAPPVNSTTFPVEALSKPKYSYFNLHGMESNAAWLGQRNNAGKGIDPLEFPIVLVPSLVASASTAPSVVFSEACYGANILKKATNDAVSLEMLSRGTRAFVGSTKIGYGAAAAPLIAADLLGNLYLRHLLEGMAAGEALRQAKLGYASEMNRRQGNLDPEDQKTLISFVLYGDPLYMAEPAAAKAAAQPVSRRVESAAPFSTIDVRNDLMENGSAPSEKAQAALKKTMEQYLPGMNDSRMRYLHPRPAENGPEKRGKAGAARTPAWVVALDRKYQAHGQEFTQYAKISMDARGRVVKVVVSR